MIVVFVICLAVLVAVWEKKWTPVVLSYLSYRGVCDQFLVEPGTAVTWTGTVENKSRLPVLFVRLWEYLPAGALVQAEEEWLRTHENRGLRTAYIEERFSLMARQKRTCQIVYELPKRGRYEFGRYMLAAGDLLGIDEKSRQGDLRQHVVVMPGRIQDVSAMDVLGGFLGDLSVRRFIMEDPILTVGFRDYSGREPMKDISWTRSAVAGRLQVRQYDYTVEQRVTVLLNVEGAGKEMLENCFSLTRMVCEELERKHIPYAFQTNGDAVGPVGRIWWLAEGLGSQHLDTVLYALGQASSTCFFSFQTMIEQCMDRAERGASYILITPPLSEKEKMLLNPLQSMAGTPVCVLMGKEET